MSEQARMTFWQSALDFTTPATVFELSVGDAENLRIISSLDPTIEFYGSDPDVRAVNAARAQGFEVQIEGPHGIAGLYPPGTMDLVFTAMNLCKASPEVLDDTMRRLIELSGRYVLAIEPEDGRNFGELYEGHGLRLLSVGEAGGWDGALYWLLERPDAGNWSDGWTEGGWVRP